MRASQVVVGNVYVVKVSGVLSAVRIDRVSRFGGWVGVNVQTGREVQIKTAGRLRGYAKTDNAGQAMSAAGRPVASTGQLTADERLAMVKEIHAYWFADCPRDEEFKKNEIMKGLYAFNDAYGPVGKVPAQGYDWSGIRDSSDGAIASMHRYLSERLAAAL